MAPFNFHLLLVLSFNFENVVLSLNQCPGHCNYFAHLLWHLLFMNCYRWYVRKSSYTWYTQSLYLVLIAVLQAFLFGFIMLRPCYAQKLICVQLFVTPWSLQASLSLGFSRQEYWRELPILPPGDLPDPGSRLCLLNLLHWQMDSLPLSHLGNPSMLMHSVPIRGLHSLIRFFYLNYWKTCFTLFLDFDSLWEWMQ